MTFAIDKSVPKALSINTWIKDFIKAVKPAASSWVTAYIQSNRKEIEAKSLTFYTVVNHFREEIGSDIVSTATSTPNKVTKGAFVSAATPVQTTKGAFGPTHDGKEPVPRSDATRPSTAPALSHGHGDARAEEISKYDVTADGDTRGTKRKRCPACGLLHKLSECFYAFSEQAPDWFTPKEKISFKIEENLAINVGLKKQIKQISNKKKRTSNQLRSVSARIKEIPDEDE